MDIFGTPGAAVVRRSNGDLRLLRWSNAVPAYFLKNLLHPLPSLMDLQHPCSQEDDDGDGDVGGQLA